MSLQYLLTTTPLQLSGGLQPITGRPIRYLPQPDGGVRYQVKDVSRSVAFYAQQLGLNLDRQMLPAFAQVSIGQLKLILSGPGASGSRPMPDGRAQDPGGRNRVVLQVVDLPAMTQALKQSGEHFRNQMEVGPGGRQIQIENPDGNPKEQFEPAR